MLNLINLIVERLSWVA